ncbi:hypothetical protein VHEMI05898 [[Torrubiella] hemipterigena]|uniref:Uncharacterized protein n=1 Tax=[Torrubiella] hemipterigena TaxID=1531966 RepID=A0A0A1SZ41_9HYPO|nr:hypothetical protein VHEMI05898 [[Torrubiella] hemipterigena]
MSALPQYQVLITSSDAEKEAASKRRILYLRPFLLFWLTSLAVEIFLLAVAVLFISGTRELIHKMIWTLVLCPLGMGGALGGITNVFLVDVYYGKKAVWFTTLLTFLVLGSCNYLCFSLDHYFGYFGAEAHPMWFHWRYPALLMMGYNCGNLLFTDEGQKKLASWGL